MNAAEQTQAEQQLEQARQRIGQWRQTRTKLGAMPAPLWVEAAAVARKLGTHRAARALGLNYLVLKNRAFPAGVRSEARKQPQAASPSAKRPTFVEVKVAPSIAPAAVSEAVVVEVVATNGARLTLRLTGGVVGPELAALVSSFR